MAHNFIHQDLQTSFSDNNMTTDPNMGFLSNFHHQYELISSSQHGDFDTSSSSSSNLNIQSLMGIFSSQDCCFQIPDHHHHHHQFPVPPTSGNLSENFPCFFLRDDDDDHHHHENKSSSNNVLVSPPPSFGKKRKPVDDDVETRPPAAAAEEQSSSANSSPPSVLSNSGNRARNSTGRGKKVKCNDDKEEEKKAKDVVHVRARRGQATDSHSLAERVRRGKINERLKCLQDIVPGCHKTMGMAVMLDEIINYVQSLQSQVEFLSMKLTAASNFYNFNAETDTMDFMQRAKAYEAVKMQKLLREGCDGIASTQLGNLDLTFGCIPSLLPYNK